MKNACTCSKCMENKGWKVVLIRHLLTSKNTGRRIVQQESNLDGKCREVMLCSNPHDKKLYFGSVN